ncbi:MAG: hypothetical protein ACI4VW_01650 [Acutalibacteraceae bacterium]
MNKLLKKQNIKKDILSGLTGAMLLGSYSLCGAACSGLELLNVFFCIVICALFSMTEKNKIYAPDVFLLLPVLYVVSSCGIYYLPICIVGGAIIYFFIEKLTEGKKYVESAFAVISLVLALWATVILTNKYFGIGAQGSTPFEMLKSYRSLGFHPHFRGLLYGTITLFAMITYPFKFKKLNKILPAEFMTLVIPLVLNLFLNPEQELTTVNEIPFSSHIGYASPFTLTTSTECVNLWTIPIGILFFALCLLLRSSKGNTTKNTFTNIVCGGVSLLPARQFETERYSPLSVIITIGVSGLVILLCPNILSRIPMHCVGALLIVSAWQQVPYRKLSALFKKNDREGA